MTAAATTITAGRMGLDRKRMRGILLGTIPFFVLLGIWELNTFMGWLKPVYIPPLHAVVGAVFTLQEGCPASGILGMHESCLFTNHVLSSLGRVGLGLIVGVPLGIGLGVLAGMSRRLGNALEPVGVFANAISGSAWVPLAIVWFGVGWFTTLFILLNTVFWLVFFNTLLGVRSVPRTYEHSVLTLGGNRWHVISQVYIPGALPSIVTGVRMGIGFGWRALIAAEMIGGNSGLGFMIFVSAGEYKVEEVFLGVLLIGIIWMVTDRTILVPLEKWTIERWGLVWRPS